MPEPDVIRQLRSFKRGLREQETAQRAELLRRWLQLEEGLSGRIDALTLEIAALKAAGKAPRDSQLVEMARFQELAAEAQREAGVYEDWAAQKISAWQQGALRLGADEASEAIRAQGISMGINLSFRQINPDAFTNIIGFCADGAPLFDILKERAIAPDAIGGLVDKLVQAIGKGWNPRKTASAMKDGLSDGLQKALVIARTEQMRAYRLASTEEYRESGVVVAMRRLATKDAHTCMGCLMLDGELIPLDGEVDDHPQGRCTAVPMLQDGQPVEWQTGREWFEQQSADTQREMMGDGKYEAWQDGQFGLDALATKTSNPTWGDSVGVAPLGELVNIGG